ncbi:cytochrome c oxidase subunit 6C-like [Tubulanus polymorphus]|uniref:cytochrome c oxidase subunit 6C-like n=1 Tax=Tubulanus polymorphus TaxID=672921 RepID=UPI003DA3FF62
MSSSVTKIAKPQLRRLLTSSLKRELFVGGLIGATVVIAYKALVNDPRKQRYAEFYQDYDMKRDFERMKAANIFTSARPDGSIDEW